MGLNEQKSLPKKIKYAAALRYRPGQDSAPLVVAAGQGELAESLLKIASEAQIPQYTEPALAKLLSQIEPGTTGPEETYQLVAQILAFIWEIDKDYSN